MKKIEKVKLDDNLKPIKHQFNYDVFLGLYTMLTMIFSILAIWSQGIYIKIFFTMLVILLFIIAIGKREK